MVAMDQGWQTEARRSAGHPRAVIADREVLSPQAARDHQVGGMSARKTRRHRFGGRISATQHLLVVDPDTPQHVASVPDTAPLRVLGELRAGRETHSRRYVGAATLAGQGDLAPASICAAADHAASESNAASRLRRCSAARDYPIGVTLGRRESAP